MENAQDISAVRTSVSVGDLILLLRPTQWIKNVVIFAGPAAALKLAHLDAFFDTVIAFVSFCLAASATYAINDVLDREADANHPEKRLRPIARGAIRPQTAVGVAALLIVAAVTIPTLLVNTRVTTVLVLYLVLTMAYSVGLKRQVLLDVIIVASGFVLRAWAGSLAVGVDTSAWLVACVFTLCLFLGFGKRRCELAMIGDANEAGQHRRTLLRYTPELLNHLITVSAGIAVITFLLYTMTTEGHPAPFRKEDLFYTLPLVIYGIFRYAMLTELGIHSGPTEIVLRDRPLLATILIWAVVALAIAYQTTLFGPAGIEGLWMSH